MSDDPARPILSADEEREVLAELERRLAAGEWLGVCVDISDPDSGQRRVEEDCHLVVLQSETGTYSKYHGLEMYRYGLVALVRDGQVVAVGRDSAPFLRQRPQDIPFKGEATFQDGSTWFIMRRPDPRVVARLRQEEREAEQKRREEEQRKREFEAAIAEWQGQFDEWCVSVIGRETTRSRIAVVGASGPSAIDAECRQIAKQAVSEKLSNIRAGFPGAGGWPAVRERTLASRLADRCFEFATEIYGPRGVSMLPPRPDPFDTHFYGFDHDGGSEVSRRMLRSGVKVGKFCWSWTPGSDRVDGFTLTRTTDRRGWLLWTTYPDDSDALVNVPFSVCVLSDADPRTAAVHLIIDAYRALDSEWEGMLEHPHEIYAGMLTEDELKVVAAKIWGGPWAGW